MIIKKNRFHAKEQPAVIPVFFLTEMWERFGFYMIQALLVLYMTSRYLNYSDDKSYAILGAVSAMAYIMPLLGGYLAGKVLDYEHAVILGGLLLVTGYALLALPNENLFFLSLAIMTIGTGFFKPNISSYLGDFYRKDDPYREKGYTIFYIGINLGILISTMISGYVVRYFGWHAPFLLASVGLLIGIAVFVFGLRYLKHIGHFHRIKPATASKNSMMIFLVYLSIPAQIAFSYYIIKNRTFANDIMLWGGIGIFVILFLYAFKFENTQRNRLHVALLLIIVSAIYWSLYFQMFFSMNLFIERAVDRTFYSWRLPTPIFASSESIFVIMFGPFLALLWQKLSSIKKNPGTPLKFALAMFLLCVAFLVVFAGTKLANGGLNNMIFILITYCLIAITELLLSPIGLAMITVLSPKELVGLMMGVWFVSLGIGEKTAGIIANYAAIPKHIILISSMDVIYGDAFFRYAIISLICAIAALLFVPLMNRMIK